MNAPQLHDDAPGNVCFRFARGDEAAVRRRIRRRGPRGRLDLVNNRLIGAAIEPRARAGRGRRQAHALFLDAGAASHPPHGTEQLGLPQTHPADRARRRRRLRLQGQALSRGDIIAWAARRLRRPVKWVATRSECFVSDYQGRGHRPARSLRSTRRGISSRFASTPWPTSAPMCRPSAPASRARSTARFWPACTAHPPSPSRCTGVFTNTVPTDAYRGAGPPGGLLRAGAPRRRGRARARDGSRRDPAAQSRAGRAMPYKTPIGPTYDCGNFPKIFARALEIADYKGFAKRQAMAQARGRLRGFGIACYVESSGRRAVADGGGARRPRRLLRSGANPRAAGRQRAGAARHPQPRPGPRHDLRPDHLVAARRADGERSRSSRATPIRCRTARARSARAPSRSAARRSTAPR